MPRRIQKAFIVKVPEKYIVVNTKHEVVDFGRSGYHATEVARAHGARTVEMMEWTELLKSVM